jgi:hypothetical protein
VEDEEKTQTLTLTQKEKELMTIARKMVYLYTTRVGCVYSNDQYSMYSLHSIHSMYIACTACIQHAMHSMYTARSMSKAVSTAVNRTVQTNSNRLPEAPIDLCLNNSRFEGSKSEGPNF